MGVVVLRHSGQGGVHPGCTVLQYSVRSSGVWVD